MKHLAIYIAVLSTFCYAQKNIVLNDTYQQILVEDMPKDVLPKGASQLMFVKSFEGPEQVYYFGYLIQNNTFRVIQKLTEGGEWINPAKSYSIYKNDTIYLQSEQPFRATTNEYYFLWKNGRLSFIRSEISDPSWAAVENAETALAAGRIQEAIDNYYMVMYPMSYIDENEVGLRILSRSNEMALKLSENKNYVGAVNYIDTAMGYYSLLTFTEPLDTISLTAAFENNYVTQYKDSFGLWMANYGYFLYKADLLQKSIEINGKLNNTYPQLSGPFLQHADALYDLGKKNDSKPLYHRYVQLMIGKGKEKNIPERVKERIK